MHNSTSEDIPSKDPSTPHSQNVVNLVSSDKSECDNPKCDECFVLDFSWSSSGMFPVCILKLMYQALNNITLF